MSRIGKLPVTVPAGVEITVSDSNLVTVKGPKGTLCQQISKLISVENENGVITLKAANESREANMQHGLARSLVHNMVVGVTEGFQKKLEMTGVGYRATLKGTDLDLSLGYSHPVIYKAPENISFEVPDNTHIIVKGISKEQVGQVAAEIRAKRPPEPYKGKGIHYEGEHIRRKLGKAAK